MSLTFFHGARVTESTSGQKAITTLNTSVIGLLGTAPDSEAAASASLLLGTVAANNGLTFTAKNPGALGNQTSVAFRNPAQNSQALSVSVSKRSIVVNLATGATGAVTSTAEDVLSAITASAAASALVTVTETGASTGAGVVTPTAAKFLSGGADEAFPLNTPVLVSADRTYAARAGATGTLPDAFDDIFDQCGAVVVVVRVAKGLTDEATNAAIIGGTDANGKRTGMQALLSAQSILGVKPKILIAPGFTSEQSVLSEFVSVAESLRAHIIAEGPDTTDAAAQAYGQNFGSRRIFLVDPGIQKTNAAGDTVIRANSASVAGLIARVDSELGFHWSPSNQEIYSITGTTRAVDWVQGDENCRANILNSENVATIIRRDGFRLWGNRTLSSDPTYAFLCVSRVADVLAESIELAEQWRVDRPVTKQFLNDVADEITAYLRSLKNQGVILGGKCWPDPDLNTADNIKAGKVYFNFDWTPCYPAEDIEIKSMLVETYLADLTK